MSIKQRKILLASIFLLCSFIGSAQTIIEGNIKYEINEKEGTAVCTGPESILIEIHDPVIQDFVTYEGNKYPVTEISEKAFSSSNLTGNLKLGNQLISIGPEAFHFLKNLTGSLIIPNSVVKIGAGAFRDCNGFNGSLTIGDSVEIIEESAFFQCDGFKGNLYLGKNLVKICHHAFSACLFSGSLNIPNSVEIIEYNAFSKCSFDGEITLGNSIQNIGRQAFYECANLKGELILPSSIVFIDELAFRGCKSLTSLVIPETINTLNDMTFFECNSLEKVVCWNNTPPQIKGTSPTLQFARQTYENAVLEVPLSSINLYKEATMWKQFESIKGISEEIIPNKLKIVGVSLENIENKKDLKESETLYLTAQVEPAEAQYSKILWSVDKDGFLDVITKEKEKNTEVEILIKENVKSEKVTIIANIEDNPSVSASYTININPLLLGDANDDKGVTVTDVMVIAAKILNQNTNLDSNPVESFCFINADVYPNKKIEVDDQDATLLIARGLSYKTQSLTRSSEVNSDYLSWSINEDNVIALRFDNPSQFINLQADITIPTGFEVEEVVAGSLFNGHILGYNMIEENVLRILVYSLKRNEFRNNSGNLIEVRLKGSGNTDDLSFNNIISTDKNSSRYELQPRNYPVSTSVSDVVTEDISVKVVPGGIGIYNAQGMVLTIVKPDGQIVNKQMIGRNDEIIKLSQGMYLISVGNLSKKILVK